MMEKAKFLVDYCYEAGSFEDCGVGNLTEEFEELYQVWFDNDCDLNSWDSEWKDHKALYDKINNYAGYALNELLKEHDPELQNPIEVLWEISNETEKVF